MSEQLQVATTLSHPRRRRCLPILTVYHTYLRRVSLRFIYLPEARYIQVPKDQGEKSYQSASPLLSSGL